MSENFITFLENRAQHAGSLLCIGLDPHPEDLPAPTAQAALDFCLRLVGETAEWAAAFKPNAAFFEAFGSQGWASLEKVIAAIPEGIPVILDAKRGDIASTAQAYARSAFEILGVNAITASPYLGFDSLEPLIADPRRGVFLLCKTSNPGAADLQDLTVLGGRAARVYEHVARLACEWNQLGNVGLVVGATQPLALQRVRAIAPDLWILAPGVGVQGGDLRAALEAGLRADGSGILLPVSRGISRASDPRQAARGLVAAIQDIRIELAEGDRRSPERSLIKTPAGIELLNGILAAGCIKFGQFTLKSGMQSPIYIDLRQLVSFPVLLSQVASSYLSALEALEFTRLAALPYAAIPIATAVGLQGGWPVIYPRKEAKSYGTQAEIEGLYSSGDRVVVIDDLATTGGSKIEAIEKLISAGLKVSDVVVLVDRQSGAREALARSGYRLHALFILSDMLDHWERSGGVSVEKAAEVRRFLAGFHS